MASSTACHSIPAVSIGSAAWRALTPDCTARVIGFSSRGVFLLVPPQHIVFVSGERYRSPLTINLDRSDDRLRAVEVGAMARFSDTRLIFPSIAFSISLAEDVVWQCPSATGAARPSAERVRTLRAIAEGVLAQRGHDGLAALLPTLLGWPATAPLSAEQSALLDRLSAVRRAMRVGDVSALLAGLTSLLGQGRGLTPSGDDVLIGLLLMLNRWHLDRDWAVMNRSLMEAAYRVTTTISANLIEWAASGQGDERLIAVVDGIATGTTSIDECVDCVLDWGSSSGSDALVGMTVAVTARS